MFLLYNTFLKYEYVYKLELPMFRISMFSTSFLLPVLDSRLDRDLWVCKFASALTLIIFQVLSLASERRLWEVSHRYLEAFHSRCCIYFPCEDLVYCIVVYSLCFHLSFLFEKSCIIVRISCVSIWGREPLTFRYEFMSISLLYFFLL